MILALIDCDPNSASTGGNLLVNAANRGSVEIIDKLIDLNVDFSIQDEHGWTPLQLARQNGHTATVALLFKRGAVAGSRPEKWVSTLAPIKLFDDGIGLEHSGEESHACMIMSNHPVPAGMERFYYEINVDPNVGEAPICELAVGFTTKATKVDRVLPGLTNPTAKSWALHGDMGGLFVNGRNINENFERIAKTTFSKGNTIGCGIIYASQDVIEASIFYTLDGKALGVGFDGQIIGRMYPTIGISEAMKCTVNWGLESSGAIHGPGTADGTDTGAQPFMWKPANKKWNLESVKVSAEERAARLRLKEEEVEINEQEEEAEKAKSDEPLEERV